MESHFAGVFQQQRYSDAELSIQLPRDCVRGTRATAAHGRELNKFPVHLVILSQSPYFQSQDKFLEQQQQQQRTRERSRSPVGGRTRSSRSKQGPHQHADASPLQRRQESSPSCSSSSNSNRRPTLVLTIEDITHEPAATAVIAAMYGVKDALSNLQHQQLVHAVQYADLLQAESATTQALHLLQTAAESEAGLALQALEALAALPSWPECMLQLLPYVAKAAKDDQPSAAAAAAAAAGAATSSISTEGKNKAIQQTLVATLGSLEDVWQQQHLSQLLLQLPVPAMQLLLSSDQLHVYSEDTVLYTVNKYVSRRLAVADDIVYSGAKVLSGLVRVPQLSDFQLIMQASSSMYPDVMSAHHNKLQQVLQLRRFQPSTFTELQKFMQDTIEDVPSSWLCGPRQICSVPDSGVQLVWKLPVSELKSLCQKTFQTRKTHSTYSCCSPPLAGLEWRAQLQCAYDKETERGSLGLFAKAAGCPSKVVVKYSFRLEAATASKILRRETTTPPLKGVWGQGWVDFFGLGAMSDGWNASAWVSRGWPSEGELEITLSMFKVF